MTDPTSEPTAVEERVARHLAARDWLTDEDRWTNSTAAFRADYLTAAREVIALVQQPATVPVSSPPADRAALRDRIRRAVCEAEGFMWNEELLEPDEYGEVADAVLAVLPEPASQAAELSDRERAMLGFALEMAQEEIYARSLEFTNEDKVALKSLRRRADETPAAPCAECGHPSATHREGDDPVSPGRCSLCPDDDAWHDHQPAPAQVPTPLRWGLDDVLHGDDDTTMLMLSGPAGEPYWLELEPERAAALRDSLTGPGEPAAQAGEELTSGVQQCGFDDYHDPHEWHDKPHIWCPGHSAADDAQPAQPQPDTTP